MKDRLAFYKNPKIRVKIIQLSCDMKQRENFMLSYKDSIQINS